MVFFIMLNTKLNHNVEKLNLMLSTKILVLIILSYVLLFNGFLF